MNKYTSRRYLNCVGSIGTYLWKLQKKNWKIVLSPFRLTMREEQQA